MGLAGIQKHNKKSWSDYQRYSEHVYDEKYLFEVFHNEKEHEQQFQCSADSPLKVSNASIDYWKSEANYKSRDGNSYYLSTDFIAPVTGEYTIELLFRTVTEGKFKTVWNIDNNKIEHYIKGSPEYRTRKVNDYHFQKGEHSLKIECNANICVIGIVVKNITIYRADDSLKRENRLTLIKATHKVTGNVSADEVSAEILYDSAWQDSSSLTNYLFDYRDEANLYLMNSEGEMEQVFGGYVSSCSLGNNETTLTINCAGRLIDGEKRFIVEEMEVGGTASRLEENFPLEYTVRFDNYNNATEYLFDNYEQPLNSNVDRIISAKQYDSIYFDCSTKENLDRCKTDNVTKELMPLGAYIRNGSGVNTQVFEIYNNSWFPNQDPILLDDYPIFYIEYGLGEAVTTLEAEQVEADPNAVGGEGGIVSTNYYPTCSCCTGVPYQRYQKSWRNYCPICGASGTLGVIPKSSDGEVTCLMSRGGCDSDYCCYCGGEKWYYPACNQNKLTPASNGENSNAGNTTGKSKSTTNAFDVIFQEVKRYNWGTGVSTVSQMRRVGYGDDKAFSDLIYSELVDMGVGAKIVETTKGSNNAFRSVLLKSTDGSYTDFPYDKDNFKEHFGTNLSPTGSAKSGRVYLEHDGLGVNTSDGTIEGTSAVTNGFDKDKPFKAYIVIDFTRTLDANAEHQLAYIDFTANQSDDHWTFSGLTPLFLNNIINTSSVNVIDKLLAQHNVPHVYLHKLYFEYVVHEEALWEEATETTDEEGNTTTTTESNDNSSYKMIFRGAGFRNGTVLNPIDLGSTGKTVNSVLDTVLESGELKLKLYPAQHRRDDKVILTKDKSYIPSFTIDESKNVLGISSWNYTPASDFMDRSLVVFKRGLGEGEEKKSLYNFIESRNPTDILRYGEINSLTSLSDDVSGQEAYYNARKEFRSVIGDSMTVTVVGNPKDIHIGDYVECLFENSDYNDVKEIKSIEREYDIKQAPHIQTKLGLNRPNPELRLRTKFEDERKKAKEHKTLFSRTAIYDDDVYIWEE